MSTGRYKLYSSLKDLREIWEKTREQWDDPVAHELEENYWRELEASVTTVLAAMDRLLPAMIQAREDCK